MKKHLPCVITIALFYCFTYVHTLRAQTWPSIEAEVPMWYDITDSSVVLHAVAYSAGWADLWAGGYLYQSCDTIATDTLYEELVDLEVPYTYIEWFVYPLPAQSGQCWSAYVRYDTTYFFFPDFIFFALHQSPTGVSEQQNIKSAGFVDAHNRMFIALCDVDVLPVTMIGQVGMPFFVRSGETRDVLSYAPGFLVLRNPTTGKLIGRCFVPD